MPVNFTPNFAQAAAAYGKINSNPLEGNEAAGNQGSGFGSMLGGVLTDLAGATRAAEKTTLQALSGKADVSDLVTAVASAKVAVDEFTAIRDRVIGAYQEIMRMPV
ncbi:MAG: flagellar hook-basal body complex protein FliE [Dongiaceae bacterium]